MRRLRVESRIYIEYIGGGGGEVEVEVIIPTHSREQSSEITSVGWQVLFGRLLKHVGPGLRQLKFEVEAAG